MYRVYSGYADFAKLNRSEIVAYLLNFFCIDSMANASQREMRGEGTFFLFITEAI